MKKLFIFYFFMHTTFNLFSQNYNYGLSQSDLNLLLGQFVPNTNIASYRWVAQSFSWGRQTAIDTNGDNVQIDYDIRFALGAGEKYKNHLVIWDSALAFVITNIRKTATNSFVLSLVFAQEFTGAVNAGQITITFLDDIHAVIDNTNCLVNLFNYMVLWKSAGPTVTVNKKRNFLELPAFEE